MWSGIIPMKSVVSGDPGRQVLNRVDSPRREPTRPCYLVEVLCCGGGHAMHEPPEDVSLGLGPRAARAGEGELSRPS
jgi:hypothetical protein